MFTAYVVVTILTVAALAWYVTGDFARAQSTVDNMKRLGVPISWLLPLGALKAAGALGLLVGLGIPAIGVAAAIGLVLFFIGAVISHVRARWYATIPYPAGFALLAGGVLALRLATA